MLDAVILKSLGNKHYRVLWALSHVGKSDLHARGMFFIATQDAISDKYEKMYARHRVEELCKELVVLRLAQITANSTYRITDNGRYILEQVEQFAQMKPDPWMKYLRPSRTPNTRPLAQV